MHLRPGRSDLRASSVRQNWARCIEAIRPPFSNLPTVAHRTALRELIEARLGEDVCAWTAKRRKQDPDIGWRTLAGELHRITGRSVSHGSLASWCRQPDDDEG
jgi:hypothetical protein